MKQLTLGLTVAMALTGTAYAAQGPTPRDPEARRSAVTTMADVEDRAARRFQRLDANHDGRIDRTDRAERRAGRMQMRFDRLDADRNGELSRAEFAARPALRQGRDGFEGRRGPGMRRFARRGQGPRMGRGAGFGGGRLADRDRDGAITQAEFTAQAVQRFQRLDANRDGQVTFDERRTARAEMRERRQQRGANDGARRVAPPVAD